MGKLNRLVSAIMLLTIPLLLLSGCGELSENKTVVGSGNIVREEREVSGFTQVVIASGGELVINQAEKEAFAIEGDDNVIKELTSTVRDGVLTISKPDSVAISPSRSIRYELTVNSLNSINIGGSVRVVITDLETNSLTVKAGDNCDIQISGKTDWQTVELEDGARYFGENFIAREGRVQLSDLTKAVVNVTDRLDVSVSGETRLEYIGNPQLTQEISGDSAQISQRKP